MDILTYAAVSEAKWKMALADMTDYVPKYTFYADLSIAECFGIESIKDTIKRVLKEWMSSIEAITEFVMCVNHKSWEHVDNNPELSQAYADLYYEVQDKVLSHYENDSNALSYYYRITD